MRRVLPLLLVSLAFSAAAPAQRPTRPDAYLGRPLAADFQLPDWGQVKGYFETLDAESARVELRTLGKTTEGRDFVLAVISSEANLARIDRLKECAAICTDPRGKTREQRLAAVAEGKPFLFISCAMHATECAAPQFAMQLAWELATSDEAPYKAAREECVVLLAPSLNPDGLDHVAEWYRRTVNTPYEASELPKLYQLYCGHDNNRDWFALTQAETKLVTRALYVDWKPQVYWDVHQQGSKQERLFVPPFRDPLDPNLDPAIVCGMNLLGTRGQFDLTREGKTGVATGGTYDMWWNGGNRNVPVRHNIVGLLTEAASCRLASPIFLQKSELRSPTGAAEYRASNAFPSPWPGGWWRLADIVQYELGFARSLLGSLSAEPRFWMSNQMEAAERAIQGDVPGMPRGWVLPSDTADRGALLRLVDVLAQSGVELSIARKSFDADGRSWPVGSIVISAAQPYSRHVKDLFEVQQYPQGDPPYDVAGWTLPALFGVDASELRGEFDAAPRRIADVTEARALLAEFVPRKSDDLDLADSDGWSAFFLRSAKGEGFRLVAEKGGLRAKPGSAREAGPWSVERAPRIALHAPWSGNMDEGWTRWVFDTFRVPYTSVRNEALRAGRLRAAYDVLVLPGIGANELDHGRDEGTTFDELTGGLDPEGAVAIEEFVREGGTLVALGGSAGWAVQLFELPLEERTAADKDFSCPGSVLRAIPDSGTAIVEGLPSSVHVFGAGPRAWRVTPKKDVPTVDVLLRWAPTRTLLSGYLAKPETIAGEAAWVRARHGQGTVHVFGFRPQYRGWSQQAFQLLFRAIVGR
ncbi:MAG: peptidase M14 [Planctomycetes bacterium]|nr:peptidase M14 [Planctomycetota bacterium]